MQRLGFPAILFIEFAILYSKKLVNYQDFAGPVFDFPKFE
jgi:hypothetical protein